MLNQLTINGYKCYDTIQSKNIRAFRNSGGLAVFIKDTCYDMFDISNVMSE